MTPIFPGIDEYLLDDYVALPGTPVWLRAFNHDRMSSVGVFGDVDSLGVRDVDTLNASRW
jgi:hypothetical protein